MKESTKYNPRIMPVNSDDAYERGLYYLKDKQDDRGAYWVVKAAEDNHIKAQYTLGVLFEKGIGPPQNYEDAFYWFLKAAEQGDATSQHLVGENMRLVRVSSKISN